MRITLKILPALLLAVMLFSCSKEPVATPESSAVSSVADTSQYDTYYIDLPVMERNAAYAVFQFTATDAVDVEYKLINLANMQTIDTEYFYSSIGYYTFTTNIGDMNLRAQIKVKRRFQKLTTLTWRWRRFPGCPQLSGVINVTTEYTVPWGQVSPQVIVPSSFPCQ